MGDRHYPVGTLVGRARVPGYSHPRIVTVRNDEVVDITTRGFATVRDIAESGRAAEHVRNAVGQSLGKADTILANSVAGQGDGQVAGCPASTCPGERGWASARTCDRR